MAVQNRNTIRGWLLRGMKPLAGQFSDWLDSFWHKDEMIPMASVTDLNTTLGTLTTAAAIKGLYRDTVNLVNADGNYILNAGTFVLGFIIESSLAINFKTGTTAGGDEILIATAIPANEVNPEPILVPVYRKAQSTIYFSGIAGTGATVKVTIIKNSI